MIFEITKVYRFEMAHQLATSVTKECQNIHGHSYKLEVTFSNNVLNHMGMVIDFKVVNQWMRPIIERYDHAFLTRENYGRNPTAEQMAREIHQDVWTELAHHNMKTGKTIRLVRVRLWETETGMVEFRNS